MSTPDAADPNTRTAGRSPVPVRQDAEIFVATYVSSHYTWTGFGLTRRHAVDGLVAAWTCAGADPDYLYRDDINVVSGPPGAGFRDDRLIITS